MHGLSEKTGLPAAPLPPRPFFALTASSDTSTWEVCAVLGLNQQRLSAKQIRVTGYVQYLL